MQTFLINDQWKLYLKNAGLKEADMPPDQVREMKRAFFGACGQMLILQRDELSKLPTKRAISTLQRMLQEVVNFWYVEANKQN